MISVSHLSKKYGEKLALNDVSFNIEDGHIYGFLGPNGAGKSTTMNIITGYISPSSGSVVINDANMLTEPNKAKKHIGYLPEMPPLYMDMTVYEYLRFVAELKGIKNKQSRIDDVDIAMYKVNIEIVKNRLIKNLSKGYKQRVGIAAALLGNPEIIILDEPSVGLDPKQIVEIRRLIKNLGKDHTVILSSHILSEISEVCDRIIIINNGNLVANDTPSNLIARFNRMQQIDLCLLGNASKATHYLEEIEGMDSYAVISEDEISCRIKLIAKEGLDIRREVSTAAISNGFTLLELNVKSISLEDVYLMLTRKEGEE